MLDEYSFLSKKSKTISFQKKNKSYSKIILGESMSHLKTLVEICSNIIKINDNKYAFYIADITWAMGSRRP